MLCWIRVATYPEFAELESNEFGEESLNKASEVKKMMRQNISLIKRADEVVKDQFETFMSRVFKNLA